ncbi:PrsW family intramembrane metalloprotease [Actinomyces lilanjuaniae]|uniref:PrsW family intramembrane metalloprotease n=1 Tax=Actinomyces lilanjuaniae TaxID=2321394 RepID=A0ABM6Z153_9ACTO|nr:PrsW family intramembrane metalloprotease [Actinomyces lilanjuaniae]
MGTAGPSGYGIMPGTHRAAVPEGVAQKEPPEVWERAVAAFQAWMRRRPGLVRALARLTRVIQVVTLVLLVAALLLVPRLAVAMVPAVFMMGCLLVMGLLARTRTVGVRLLSLVLGLSTAWALVVALATREVAQAVGLTVQDDGARIALAAFVEEPGKLVPLLVVALVAPGWVRRLAAVDWGLLGFAAGAGFTAAEDAVRRLAPPTLLEQVVGEQRLEYSLNPWTAGSSPSRSRGCSATCWARSWTRERDRWRWATRCGQWAWPWLWAWGWCCGGPEGRGGGSWRGCCLRRSWRWPWWTTRATTLRSSGWTGLKRAPACQAGSAGCG